MESKRGNISRTYSWNQGGGDIGRNELRKNNTLVGGECPVQSAREKEGNPPYRGQSASNLGRRLKKSLGSSSPRKRASSRGEQKKGLLLKAIEKEQRGGRRGRAGKWSGRGRFHKEEGNRLSFRE